MGGREDSLAAGMDIEKTKSLILAIKDQEVREDNITNVMKKSTR